MSAEGLLPCPFCGHAAEQQKGGAQVSCTNAACTVNPSVSAFTTEEAVEYWNRRAHPLEDGRLEILTPATEPSTGTKEDGLREAAEIARQIITETGVVSDNGRPGLAGLVADRIHAAILARITDTEGETK